MDTKFGEGGANEGDKAVLDVKYCDIGVYRYTRDFQS